MKPSHAHLLKPCLWLLLHCVSKDAWLPRGLHAGKALNGCHLALTIESWLTPVLR